MRIAAHIGVKDEVELIERVIKHLRSVGVDLFIVCDMYSTDGTAEILGSYQSDDFRIIKIANSEPGEVWLRRNEEAIEEIEADWLVFLDADEFLLPITGSLRDCLGMAYTDLLIVPRYNVPLGPDGPLLPNELVPNRYDEVQLIVRRCPRIRDQLSSNPLIPWILSVPMPKVIVRPKRVGRLTDGMHEIISKDASPLTSIRATDIVIAHQALTSSARFTRKVENIREYLAYNDSYFAGEKGWHWKRWVDLAACGKLDHEFKSSVFSNQLVHDLRGMGVIRSAAEMLTPML